VLKPCATVTDVGMDAIADPPLRTARFTGVFAATPAFRVTLPVVLRPPRIGVGETLTAVSCGGSKVRVPEPVWDPSDTVTFTVVVVVTALVACVNDALCVPDAMKTGLGFTAALSLVRFSVIPLGGASPRM
jgi:hypothetical protein